MKSKFAALLASILFLSAGAVSLSAQKPSSSAVSSSSSSIAALESPQLPPPGPDERAKVFMATKRYEAAIEEYNDLLKKYPKNAPYLNMAGIAYMNLGNNLQARKYFERSAKADKKYASPLNNLGMIWYQQKDYRRAIRQYQRAIKIDSSQSALYANLGFAYYNTKKYTEAFQQFHIALQLDPHAFEHNDRNGSMTQDRSVTNHGLFFFMMAREFAQMGDAEHCADYLKKSFDEGYPDVATAKTDPLFKKVVNDPLVQNVFLLMTPPDQKTASAPPGA
jgi:tetratricopeptide (TPR) repeat protein